MTRGSSQRLKKKAKLALSIGQSLLTASLVWLMANLGKLVYGLVEPYESFIPLTFLVIGLLLTLIFHDV